jgi:hypothetical protein
MPTYGAIREQIRQAVDEEGKRCSEQMLNYRLLAAFGEWQVMTQPVAGRLCVSPLIHKGFRGGYH